MANCEMEDSHEAGSAPLTRVTNILTANDSSTESPHLSAIEECNSSYFIGGEKLPDWSQDETDHSLVPVIPGSAGPQEDAIFETSEFHPNLESLIKNISIRPMVEGRRNRMKKRILPTAFDPVSQEQAAVVGCVKDASTAIDLNLPSLIESPVIKRPTKRQKKCDSGSDYKDSLSNAEIGKKNVPTDKKAASKSTASVSGEPINQVVEEEMSQTSSREIKKGDPANKTAGKDLDSVIKMAKDATEMLHGTVSEYTYEIIEKSAQYLLERTCHRPKIGIICGSGLGELGDLLKARDVFPYDEIPNFPICTVPGHSGQMVIGLLGDVPVMCMQGRFHCYEGYPLWKCAMPVRVMKLVGVTHLIVTNAAGGLNLAYNVGDIMILKDHIRFTGDSPLKGHNDERFGPRFPSMNNSYDAGLRQMAKKVAAEIGIQQFIHEGVYVMLGGPEYETVAQLRLLRMSGVDAVGMSTVPEVIVARHCGMTVFAFSLIANECITDYNSTRKTNHAEVIKTANHRQNDLKLFVTRIVTSMSLGIKAGREKI